MSAECPSILFFFSLSNYFILPFDQRWSAVWLNICAGAQFDAVRALAATSIRHTSSPLTVETVKTEIDCVWEWASKGAFSMHATACGCAHLKPKQRSIEVYQNITCINYEQCEPQNSNTIANATNSGKVAQQALANVLHIRFPEGEGHDEEEAKQAFSI